MMREGARGGVCATTQLAARGMPRSRRRFSPQAQHVEHCANTLALLKTKSDESKRVSAMQLNGNFCFLNRQCTQLDV